MTYDQYLSRVSEFLPDVTINAMRAELFSIWSNAGGESTVVTRDYDPVRFAASLASTMKLETL